MVELKTKEVRVIDLKKAPVLDANGKPIIVNGKQVTVTVFGKDSQGNKKALVEAEYIGREYIIESDDELTAKDNVLAAMAKFTARKIAKWSQTGHDLEVRASLRQSKKFTKETATKTMCFVAKRGGEDAKALLKMLALGEAGEVRRTEFLKRIYEQNAMEINTL